MPQAPIVIRILAVAGESKIVLKAWKAAQKEASRYQQRSTVDTKRMQVSMRADNALFFVHDRAPPSILPSIAILSRPA